MIDLNLSMQNGSSCSYCAMCEYSRCICSTIKTRYGGQRWTTRPKPCGCHRGQSKFVTCRNSNEQDRGRTKNERSLDPVMHSSYSLHFATHSTIVHTVLKVSKVHCCPARSSLFRSAAFAESWISKFIFLEMYDTTQRE